MKKEMLILCFVLFLILILIHSITAVELTLTKESYQPRETLQAEFTGNFISLEKENVFIYENGIPRPEPVISDLTKKDNKYYFYAILPNKPGNFSLRIQNTQYTESGITKTNDIIKDFEIKKTNQSSLSINPGFIVASKDFSIKIMSLSGNIEVTSNLESTNQSRTFSLIEDIEKRVEFQLPDSNTNLKIKGYTIPVFVIKPTNTTNINYTYKKIKLTFLPSEIKGTIAVNEDYFFVIELVNKGNQDLQNIKLSNTLNAKIEPEIISFLAIGNSTFINATVSTSKNKNVSGLIIAEVSNITSNLSVLLGVTKNKTQVDLNGTTIIELHCTEIGGKLCDYNETCSGETTKSLEGPCCIGNCAVEQDSNNNWIFGLLLLIVLGIIGFLIFKKVRQKQMLKKSPKDVLNDKSKKYKRRMKNKPEAEEVSGDLRKV